MHRHATSRRGRPRLRGSGLILALIAGVVGGVPLSLTHTKPAFAADHSFSVKVFSDSTDANIGDGKCKDSAGNCSLRAAVQEANALGGSTNITLQNAGTYTLSITGTNEDKAVKGDVDIRSSINLYAPPGTGNATVTGKSGFGDRLFDIPTGSSSMEVEFEPRLIIKGGTAPSGQDGGNIRSINAGYLNLNQMTVSNGSARNGGGVYVTGPSTSTFNVNLATFSGNSATGIGGGLDIEGDLVATLTRLTADNNDADQGGGIATFIADGSNGTATTSGHGYLTNNTASVAGGGGAVSRFYGRVFDVTGNSAGKGGGLQLVGANGPSYIDGRMYINNNSADAKGGGVYGSCEPECGLLGQTSIEDNSAGDDGGGMYLNGGLDFQRGVIANNTSKGEWGGALVHIGEIPLVMTNVTITENSTTATGSVDSGGVVDKAPVPDVFTNDTIAENSGGAWDGVVVTGDGAVAPQVRNTIVSDTATKTKLCNVRLDSKGHNIDSGDSCGFSASGDQVNTDPILRVLSDNGGGVKTKMLQVNVSPALDAGDNNGCPITDARWVRRPQDGAGSSADVCDIGAFEDGINLLNSEVGVTVTASKSTPKPGESVTYTVTFTNIGASGTFDSVVTSTLPSTLDLTSCSGTSVSCDVSGNTASLVFPTIGLSGQPTMTIVAKVQSSAVKGTPIDTTVWTWADNPDSNTSNNQGTATVTVG